MGRVFKREGREPASIRHSPNCFSPMFAPVTQEKALTILTRARHDLADNVAQPDQIAHRFVIGVRRPDGRQFSGTEQTGEHGGVATIRLDPIARLAGDQRWRHHIASMPKALDLTKNAIAAGGRLVAK